MLSKEESLAYIRDVLKIREPEEEMRQSRLDFLNKLLCAFYAINPFQNVAHMSRPVSERHVPGIPETKQSLLSGVGGLCFSSNLSLFMLLRSMEFDVYMNLSTVNPETNDIDDHVMLLIKNVNSEGDMFLADGGFGHPLFQAIGFDFDKESKVYNESYLRYKLVKENGKYTLMIDRSKLILSPDISSEPSEGPNTREFQPCYDFRINPTRDIEKLVEHMDAVYLDPEQTPFHKTIRAMKYRNKRLVLISNCKLVLEADDGTIHVTMIADDQDIVAAFKNYFPELNGLCVKEALKNWRTL